MCGRKLTSEPNQYFSAFTQSILNAFQILIVIIVSVYSKNMGTILDHHTPKQFQVKLITHHEQHVDQA